MNWKDQFTKPVLKAMLLAFAVVFIINFVKSIAFIMAIETPQLLLTVSIASLIVTYASFLIGGLVMAAYLRRKRVEMKHAGTPAFVLGVIAMAILMALTWNSLLLVSIPSEKLHYLVFRTAVKIIVGGIHSWIGYKIGERFLLK